ncbi:integrase [Bacillus albus]|uniref:integrase n=1 Tax=Bacillus albus TaxID=2026189 RepID=UPI001419FB18|nr:integrase [Bacillus albus]
MTLLESWSQDYLDTNPTYINHVNKFVNYIVHIGKSDKPTKIGLEDLENCIGFYNELGQINSFASMENHLSSIQSFYKFLVEKSWAADIFREIHDYQSYKEKLGERYNLTDGKEREYFHSEIVQNILNELERYFEQNNYADLKGQKKKRYKNYLILRIFLKINLIAPAKKAIIFNLTREDFSLNLRILNVNGVGIAIPNALRRDLKEAIQFTQDISGKGLGPGEKIFQYLNIDTLRHSELNTWFCSFLKEFQILDIPKDKYSYSIEVIRNSAVVELIKNGIDTSLIGKVGGVSVETVEKWYFKVNAYDDRKTNQLINAGIGRTSYYSYI